MNTFNEICARHTLGVARYMYEHAKDYKLNAENMFLLGWTHDIGLVFERDNHEQRGGALLMNNGFPLLYCIAVGSHGDSLFETGYVPEELMLLIEADLHISSITGEYVSYEKRLDEIKRTHGKDSPEYRISQDNIAYLRHVGRT